MKDWASLRWIVIGVCFLLSIVLYSTENVAAMCLLAVALLLVVIADLRREE